MDDLKRGDLVRRRSDDLLMEIDSLDESMACCHVVEPFMPARKIFISLDAIVLDHSVGTALPDSDK